ncbi:MAG TPA: D-2-hydroxyacid dehydrogenase family protein [Burkholderiales bacterium]|jgi:phosphoglycerate dehydrogenase-like enzyme
MRIAVLDDYQNVAREMADWASLGADFEVVSFQDHLADLDSVVQRLKDFEIVVAMRERTPFPRALLEKLPNLRLLVTTGMRNASIDLAASRERGVVVCGTPGASGTTGELTWGLIHALFRQIPREDRLLREGKWQTTVGLGLAGKTLGILGLGTIGSQVAKVGAAFGMEAIAWSQNLDAERASRAGARRVERDELLARSDVVTIHLVLSERTRGLIGERELARMKRTAFLVNTSRGPIVEERALAAALKKGTIAGAGIDVYDNEPIAPDHPLLSAPNTVLTPHLGYVTREGYGAYFRGAVEDIAAWRRGAPVRVL